MDDRNNIPLTRVTRTNPEQNTPKGLVPWKPQEKTKIHVKRVLEVMRHYAGDPRIGPRGLGYRLKELYPGEYVKEFTKANRKRLKAAGVEDFEKINEVLKRLCQAGEIPWRWVADGSAMTHSRDTWRSPSDFLRDAADYYERDRTEGQRVVVEVFNEAREAASIIADVAASKGVTAYSGQGATGPGLAREVAIRALRRKLDHGQDTLILGIADFDRSGIETILRPHIEHVSAFLYGTDPKNNKVIALPSGGQHVTMDELQGMAYFRQLALTPEQALDLVETDADRAKIRAYADSGDDMWSRDLALLAGVQKVELEAIESRELRQMVADALDAILDTDALAQIGGQERTGRADLGERLSELADEMDDE